MADLTITQGLKPQQRGLANLIQGMQNGLAIRDTINQRKDAGLMNQILAMGNDQDQIAAARASGRAGTLLPKIQEQQAARLKADMDRQKTQAEIGKIGAESGKFGADAQKTEFEINQGRVKAVNDAVGGLTAMGDKITKTAVLQTMMGLTNLNILTPEAAMREYEALPDDPTQLQLYVQSKMPIGDQTQRRGQDMTQEATLRGQDMTQQTAFRGQDITADTSRYGQDQQNYRTQVTTDAANQRTQAQIDAKQQRGQVIKGAGGYFVVDPTTGTAVPVTADGQQVSTPDRFAEKPEDRMERQINTGKAAQAAQGAARAAQAAADLMKHVGLNAGTGITSAFGLIPSTEAKAFRTDLENLKAQLFLPAVQAMKGLGALTNIEGEKVQASIENLDPALPPDEMRKRLGQVVTQMERLTETARREARILASRGGTIPQNAQQTQPAQQAAPPAQVAITRAQLQDAIRKAAERGVDLSMEQAVEAYRAKGIEVR